MTQAKDVPDRDSVGEPEDLSVTFRYMGSRILISRDSTPSESLGLSVSEARWLMEQLQRFVGRNFDPLSSLHRGTLKAP